MGSPSLWRGRQLTNAYYHEGSHPVEDAQVLNAEDHVVQEECHQAAEANAGDPKEGQEHWVGQGGQGIQWGDPVEHMPSSVSLPMAGPASLLTPTLEFSSAPPPCPAEFSLPREGVKPAT